MTTIEAGAPTQDEIADYQQRSQDAQLENVRAQAEVAQYSENLAYAQANYARTNTIMARLNVEGAELQQRVNFAQAASAASAIVTPGAASRRGLASLR